jgi:ubiquinone/menaquinone biosynthesis C-methylase UbiE
MIMQITTRYAGAIRYFKSRWPTYIFGFCGGLILLLAAVWLGATRGWLAFVILGLVVTLLLTYFLVMSLWSAHQIYDNQNISQRLIKLGGIQPEDTLIHIDLGRRQLAIELCRHLTTGRIIAIDVYNPQMTPSRELARARSQTRRPDPDPRLSWRDGKISLLPLADGSVQVVTMSEVASEFWQMGDRQQLFNEVFRILRPRGTILLVERVRTSTNFLVIGPAALRLAREDYWEKLLSDTGFKIKKTVNPDDLVCCFRADKPEPVVEGQLPLDFSR